MFRNFEGYPDPTAGRALANIAKAERRAKALRERAVMPSARNAKKNKSQAGRRKWPKIGVMKW